MPWPRLREIVNDLRPVRSLPAWLGLTGGRFCGRWTYVVAPACCLHTPLPLLLLLRALHLPRFQNLVSCCFNTQINCPQILYPCPPSPLPVFASAGVTTALFNSFHFEFYWSLRVTSNVLRMRTPSEYCLPLPCARSASLPRAALSLTRLIGNWFYAQLTEGPELHTLPVYISLSLSLPSPASAAVLSPPAQE